MTQGSIAIRLNLCVINGSMERKFVDAVTRFIVCRNHEAPSILAALNEAVINECELEWCNGCALNFAPKKELCDGCKGGRR